MPNKPTPITTKAELISEIAKGEKPKSDFGIGTEHEKFIYDTANFRRLPYEGKRDGKTGAGIRQLLEALQTKTGWQAVKEGDNIIGLKGTDGDSITLEPGGQFELSGAILHDIHQTCQEVSGHLRQVREACESIGAFAFGCGFDPLSQRQEVSWMPKGRYKIMREYMPTKGTMGLDMMLRTCTVQVNLDFASEKDMVQKMRIAIALQPLTTALFANSPFTEGKANGYLSYRSLAWFHTDDDRCGMLPFVFEDGFGYERWVDYLLDVPMYFIYRDGHYQDVAGLSFRDFMQGKLPGYEGEYPTLKDWQDHMTTAFPEVRLKSFIEMRGADGGSWSNLCALPALWVGLLYDDTAQAKIRDLTADWTIEEMAALRNAVPKTALATEFRGKPLAATAEEVLQIAELGLKNRARKDSFGDDETDFLKPLQDIATTGQTMAERLLHDLNHEFGGDLRALMKAKSY